MMDITDSVRLPVVRLLLIYVLAVNVVTFFVYGIDKYKSKHGKWRIPEATLLAWAVVGGSVGAWCGMKIWHHKTLHRKFRYGVPVILVLQIVLATYLYRLLSKGIRWCTIRHLRLIPSICFLSLFLELCINMQNMTVKNFYS